VKDRVRVGTMGMNTIRIRVEVRVRVKVKVRVRVRVRARVRVRVIVVRIRVNFDLLKILYLIFSHKKPVSYIYIINCQDRKRGHNCDQCNPNIENYR
jgi:hypothetical protein